MRYPPYASYLRRLGLIRPTMEVKLSKQQKVTVNGSEDIYLIMRRILRGENKISQGQEHFQMVGLNQANKILYNE